MDIVIPLTEENDCRSFLFRTIMEGVRPDLIWEVGSGAITLIFGLFLSASPSSYLRLQRVLPWIGLIKLPPDSSDEADWRKWTRRTRLIGLVLILFGGGLLSVARQGAVVTRGRPFHSMRPL